MGKKEREVQVIASVGIETARDIGRRTDIWKSSEIESKTLFLLLDYACFCV